MKVAVISLHPDAVHVSFSNQSNILIRELVRAGHDVHYISDAQPESGTHGVTYHVVADLDDVQQTDAKLYRIRPDVAIVFRDFVAACIYHRLPTALDNIPFLFWLPQEGEVLAEENAKRYTRYFDDSETMILSPHTADILDMPFAPYVPHFLDKADWNFNPSRDKKIIRDQLPDVFGNVPDGATVIFCGERNDWRKRWDLVYEYIASLHNKGVEAYLLANTYPDKSGQDGSMGAPGYNLRVLEQLYGLTGYVLQTTKWSGAAPSDATVKQLMQASDLRVSMSGSEGFGLLAVECAALGVPQITNEYAAARSTVIEELRVPPRKLSYFVDYPRNYFSNALYAEADVEAMANRSIEILSDSMRAIELATKQYQLFLSEFETSVVAPRLETAITTAVDNFVAKEPKAYCGRDKSLLRSMAATVRAYLDAKYKDTPVKVCVEDSALASQLDLMGVNTQTRSWKTTLTPYIIMAESPTEDDLTPEGLDKLNRASLLLIPLHSTPLLWDCGRQPLTVEELKNGGLNLKRSVKDETAIRRKMPAFHYAVFERIIDGT